MKNILTLALFILVTPVWACKLLKSSSWYWSNSKLIKNSTSIYLAKVLELKESKGIKRTPFNTEYRLKVIEVIRGKKVSYLNLLGGSPLEGKSDISYHKDCKLLAKLERNKVYLVFKDTFHPKSYSKIETDEWIKFFLNNK